MGVGVVGGADRVRADASLISVLELGFSGVGDMMVDGVFGDAVRPLDL
ncbi:MAG TPA: hypothetical protein VEX11_16020 [Acetobacteraceae bacterium]|nr:hypothetical protein [Acetobacteraceae bacterium]